MIVDNVAIDVDDLKRIASLFRRQLYALNELPLSSTAVPTPLLEKSENLKPDPVKALRALNAVNTYRYCISIDWAQFHVKFDKDFSEVSHPKYMIERTGQTKVFRSVYTIRNLTGDTIATFSTNANECIMPEHHGVLKIDNKQLYVNANLPEFVDKLLRSLKGVFIGITRLDIAYDFQQFFNARKPDNFIKQFLHNDIVKVKGCKFKTTGEQTSLTKSYDWISFGSKTSSINYKLYNKSHEQRNAEHKPYISKDWPSVFQNDKDVWRLEFSINASTMVFDVDNSSLHFHDLRMLTIGNYVAVFKYLFDTHFCFAHHDRSQKRMDRQKKITLLEFEKIIPVAFKQKAGESEKNSTRSTKIFINKLNQHQQELRDFDDNFQGTSKEIISKLISYYGLQEWATKKYIDHTPMPYASDIHELKTIINAD